MRKASSCQCWGICCMITGFVLVIFASFFPKLLNHTVDMQAEQSAQLTQANEADWKDIPGELDIELYRIYYMYNCTNIDDVVYKGESPEYMEFGPYTYREQDNFTDLNYGKIEDYNQGTDRDAVSFIWNQGTTYDSVGDEFFETDMYLVNQAGMGVWWAQQNSEPWRIFITLLYSVVNDGLGRQVVETGIFTQMRASEFKDSSQINKIFLVENPISDQNIVNALYNDPYYGLTNVDNYPDWNVLLSSSDSMQRQAFKSELMTYFKLSRAQVDEMESQWNNFYEANRRIVVTLCPNPKQYENDQGTAYWQWANAFVTINNNDPSEESVAKLVDTVTGYPEISYFHSEYFDKTANAQNVQAFADTKLWVSEKNPDVNYQHLFNLTQADGSDPDESSLFNVDTLKTFISLGQSTPNILDDEHKDLVYGQTFSLPSGWSDLTQKLGLADQKQTYFMWLWLDAAYDFTFEMTQLGGNMQTGVMSQMGAQAFQLGIVTMQLEFPNMLYAEQMMNQIQASGNDCQEAYVNLFGFQLNDAQKFCANENFDLGNDPWTACYNWINLYNYNTTFPVDNYAMVQNVIQTWNDDQFNQYIFDDSSAFALYLASNVVEPIYTHYQAVELCDSSITLQCANSNLTYNQWAYGSVLKNPIDGMKVNSESYQRNWSDKSQLPYTPEFFYYVDKSEQPTMDFNIQDVYQSFNISGLFNLVPYADVLLQVTYQTESNVWITQTFNKYLRWIVLQGGLNGIFIKSTPRAYLDGFNDPLIEVLQDLPVYLGGDQTTSPFLSLNSAPTSPVNNPIAFLTGEDDYLLTRQQARWLDKQYITIETKDYSSMTQLFTTSYNPWTEQVLLDGTDGMQFHPLLEDDEILGAWVNDLSRTCYFNYIDSDTTTYPGLDMMKYYIEDDQMYNLTANPANALFEIYVDGTTNMTTTLKAPAFASKGHYYQISEEIKDVSVPKLTDKNGNEILPNADDDDTWLGVERLSGVNLVARERIQLNFQVVNDELFNFINTNDYGLFIPLTYVKRESDFTNDQIQTLYAPYFMSQNAKWPIFGVMLTIGILAIIGAGLCLRKAYQLRKQEKLNVDAIVINPKKINESNNLTGMSSELLADSQVEGDSQTQQHDHYSSDIKTVK